MAITINVNGVNSGGGNQNQQQQPPTNPTPTQNASNQPIQQPNLGQQTNLGNQPSGQQNQNSYTQQPNSGSQYQQPTNQPTGQQSQPSNSPVPPTGQNQPANPPRPPQPIRYQRPDFSQYKPGAQAATNSVLPTSDRLVNDVRAEISRRGIILVPGTQNFSTMLNTIQQNQRASLMGQIDNQHNARIQDIDRRNTALSNEIKARLDISRQSELAGVTDPLKIKQINERYDRLEDRESLRVSRFFEGEYGAADDERNLQKEEAEQRLTEALQRLTEELSQGNKDSYLNNLRDKYKEQIWRRDNADTEEEVREASREAAKIQERMQRAMSGGVSPTTSKFIGTAASMLAIAGNAAIQLDRNAIQRDYVGFDMASSVLNGNAFQAIRQQNALDEQRNQIGWTTGGALAGAALGAGVGMGFFGLGAVPGAIIGGIAGLLGGVGGNAIAHSQNRSMLIEDERTRVADLWKQEENRMMGFNDLVMLTRGRYDNPNDIEGIRRSIIEASGQRPFKRPDAGNDNNDGFISSAWSAVKDFFGVGNQTKNSSYVPSNEIKDRISRYEGAAMHESTTDPLSGKLVSKNRSFDEVANGFKNALPDSIRDQVLNNRELADNLYSYYYNVKPDTFKKRVVPALEKYYAGDGTIDDITSSMWASGDKKLRGLRIRREEERAGVRNALSGHASDASGGVSADYEESYIPQDDVWRRNEFGLDIYDLGYTAPEFAQQAARRIKQRGFVSEDSVSNALYSDALERIFSMNSGALGELSKYDRFGSNKAIDDFTSLAYTLDRLGTTGMRNGQWARSDEFAGYMTQLQGSQRSTFLTVDNARAGRQIATGQAMFGDKFGAEAMQGIQAVNQQVQRPGGGFQQTLLYDVIQELYPDTRGRIDKIMQAQYDPNKQNEIQQAFAKRVQSIYGGVDTTAGFLAMQEVYGIENPNVLMPIARQLTKKGGLEAQQLDKSHNAETEAQVLNNGYTPQTTQRLNAAADQQMKSLLGYQEQISTVVQNILDKIETTIGEKLDEAVKNLK